MDLGWKFRCSGGKHSCDKNNLSHVTGSVSHVFLVGPPDLSKKPSELQQVYELSSSTVSSWSRVNFTYTRQLAIHLFRLFAYRRLFDWTGFS